MLLKCSAIEMHQKVGSNPAQITWQETPQVETLCREAAKK